MHPLQRHDAGGGVVEFDLLATRVGDRDRAAGIVAGLRVVGRLGGAAGGQGEGQGEADQGKAVQLLHGDGVLLGGGVMRWDWLVGIGRGSGRERVWSYV